jgi:hypothetical protein
MHPTATKLYRWTSEGPFRSAVNTVFQLRQEKRRPLRYYCDCECVKLVHDEPPGSGNQVLEMRFAEKNTNIDGLVPLSMPPGED